jgi:hypothetical protein
VTNITKGADLADENNDLKLYSEQMSIGGHFIITLIVLYFAGYFVVMKTKGDTLSVRILKSVIILNQIRPYALALAVLLSAC